MRMAKSRPCSPLSRFSIQDLAIHPGPCSVPRSAPCDNTQKSALNGSFVQYLVTLSLRNSEKAEGTGLLNSLLLPCRRRLPLREQDT